MEQGSGAALLIAAGRDNMQPNFEVLEFLDAAESPEAHLPEQDSPRRVALALVLVVAIVAVCDVVIYRGEGFAGYALLLALLPALMATQSLRGLDRRGGVLLAMCCVVSARLLWGGDWLGVAAGFALLPALAVALTGRAPYVFDAVNAAVQLVPGGFLALTRYFPALVRHKESPRADRVAATIVPAVVVALFGIVFALANPDLFSWASQTLTDGFRRLQQWLKAHGPGPAEVAFWFVIAWCAGGLMRALRITPPGPVASEGLERPQAARLAPLYEVHRNSLSGLVALFAVYLTYEFTTLWGRQFPPGFHYSGYAHEGAAWLTLALAMATAGLSLVFTARTLADPRLQVLRRLGNIWTVQNLLLAVAVYHRLHIYIGFNGMTRMRVVGILGISAVVAGLLLGVWKIHRRRSFFWLVQRDLWALALAMYVYCVLPVDWLTTTYNVRRILNGDPAPSVQLSVHPLNAEGWHELAPLLKCDDPLVRDGVRAMLAIELERLDARRASNRSTDWTAYQISEQLLHAQLSALRPELEMFPDATARQSARDTFDAYAYQWY